MAEGTSTVREMLRREWLRVWGSVRAAFVSNENESLDVRSLERYRRALYSILASVLARGSAVVSSLVSIPIAVRYLGPERFGVWVTVSSFTALLSFADFGIGNGVINAIAKTKGGEDEKSARIQASSAVIVLVPLAGMLLFAFFLLRQYPDWMQILGGSAEISREEYSNMMTVFACCFAAGIPLGLAGRVQIGLQESHYCHLWTGASNMAGLVAFAAAVAFKASMSVLILAFMGAPLIVQGANAIFLMRRHPWVLPRWRYVRKSAARTLVHDGLLFLLLQVSAAAIFASDNLAIANVLGAGAVALYAVPARLFSLAQVIVSTVVGPLWPAYGEALARGETDWAKRAFRRSLWFAAGSSAATSMLVVALAPWLLHAWAGLEGKASWTLLLSFVALNIVAALSMAYSTMLNGASVIRLQAMCGLATAVMAVALKWSMGARLGLPGVAFGTALALLFGSVLPFAGYVPRLLRKLSVRYEKPVASEAL